MTSTVAGPFWADGGFIALIPAIAATGFISAGAFAMAVKTRAFRWSMVAAYFLYIAVFGLYQNLWTQQLDWLLVVPLLLIVGAIAEDPADPPGLTGEAWGRIRRMTGRATTAEAASEPAPADSVKSRRGGDRRLAGGLIALGAGVIVLLFISGLVIQPLLPEPYPLLRSQQLPRGVAIAREVMTNSDRPNDNEPLQWVQGSGHTASLYSYVPGKPLSEAQRLAKLTIPQDVRRSHFDVNVWPPWRAEALFSFEQRPRNLSVTVTPTWSSEAKPQSFSAPLSEPPKGTTREFMIANWGGTKPDLFVLTRGDPQSRPILQILSGESGFHRQLYATRLPYRGLSPDEWSFQIAPIQGLPKKDENRIFRGERLDLVMIHHDPNDDAQHGPRSAWRDRLRVGCDSSRPRRFRCDSTASTKFLIGSRQGATAIYEVEPSGANGPHLKVFGLTNPPALQ